MDAAEIEKELEELEARIERLRALYEQYFLGLEKLEPLIVRKEVDRRIWSLRRDQIRNTGLRFKFQMLVQRFNTFQQYWQRVTREIESGTYRRDVIRAAQRIGEREALTIVGRKRAERYGRLVDAQMKRRRRLAGEEPPPEEENDVDLSDEVVSDAPPSPQPKAQPLDPQAARERVAALAAQVRANRRSRSSAPSAPLDLDLDLDGVRRKTSTPPRKSGDKRRGSSG